MTAPFDKDFPEAHRTQIWEDVATAVISYSRACHNVGSPGPLNQVETLVRCHRNFSSTGEELQIDLGS